MKKVSLCIAILIASAGFSCKNEKVVLDTQHQQSGLRTTTGIEATWKLRHYEDKQTAPFEVTVSFEAAPNDAGELNLSGKAPVNRYFAGYTIDKNNSTLKVKAIGATEMAGAPDAMKFEVDYFRRLQKVAVFKIENDVLTLQETTSSAETMVFEKVK